jgi:predicted DNA-binding transcriptional regulator YafY
MSHRGTIRRYTLIIEKLTREFYPSALNLLTYLDDFGFSISKRTLERDIEAIRNEFGIEIEFNRTKGGYFINKEDSTGFDSFVRFLEIVNTANLVLDGLHKTKDVLKYVLFDKGGGLKGVEQLNPLLNAIVEHRYISFIHHSYFKGETKEVSFKPYLLKEYRNRWYVVGEDQLKKQIRNYAVDRIESVKVLTKTFKPKDVSDLVDDYETNIGITVSDIKKERIRLHFSPKEANYNRSLPIHKNQVIISDDNKGMIVELNIIANYEFIQTLLMYGPEVKVVSPKWLVTHMKKIYTASLKNYN